MPQFCCHSVAEPCPALGDPMDCSPPGSSASTVSRSLLKFTSVESVMPSSHLLLCCPRLSASVFPKTRQTTAPSPPTATADTCAHLNTDLVCPFIPSHLHLFKMHLSSISCMPDALPVAGDSKPKTRSHQSHEGQTWSTSNRLSADQGKAARDLG